MSNTIISYFDEEIIGQPVQHLAWHCRLYTLLVPMKKSSNINIFEQTLLRLIAERVDSMENLVKITGLSAGFVQLITWRLQSLNLINKFLILTDKGKEAVSLFNTVSKDSELNKITILVESHTGNILDIVGNDNVNRKIIVQDEYDGRIKVTLGSKGRSNNISLIKIGDTHKSAETPSLFEVKTVFNNFQKRMLNANSLTREEFDIQNLVPHQSFDGIFLCSEPINIFLHCAVYFDSNSNFLFVKDGIGYSQTLTNILPKEIKRDIKNRLIAREINYSDQNGDVSNNIIISNLKEIKRLKKHIDDYNKGSISKNKKQFYHSNQKELVKVLYDTIEYALSELHRTHPFDEWPSFVKDDCNKNYISLQKILIDKCNVSRTAQLEKMLIILSNVNYGQVKSLNYGNMSLMPLLVKSIYSSVNLDNYAFSHLLKVYPNIFDYLHRLHGLRNSVSHGDNIKFLEYDDILDIYKIGLETIRILSPKSNLSIKDLLDNNEDLSQKYLKADVRLFTHFPNFLPEKVRNNLFVLFELNYYGKHINEKYYEIIQNSDKLRYIRQLSASIEKTLLYQIENFVLKYGNVKKFDLKSFNLWLAENKFNTDKILNKKLQNLNKKHIVRISQKVGKLVLFDLLIYYLILSFLYDDINIQTLNSQNINIVDLIANIHRLRGHNNVLTDEFKNMADENLLNLQQKTFLTIQILTQP